MDQLEVEMPFHDVWLEIQPFILTGPGCWDGWAEREAGGRPQGGDQAWAGADDQTAAGRHTAGWEQSGKSDS